MHGTLNQFVAGFLREPESGKVPYMVDFFFTPLQP
ncbi:hypothetical protein F0726_00414 [Acidithiobacillus caldus]|nr:hypothetical protein F0726_00414 [Acidithiobacillus caldus]